MYAATGWRPAFDLDAGVRDAVASLSARVHSSDLAAPSPTV
jgi:hypothetical protein